MRKPKKTDGRANNGGGGRGQGRKGTKSTLPGGAEFAQSVLARIGEIKDGAGKQLYKNAEDFGLQLLACSDVRVRKETFLALCFWVFGRPPAQPAGHTADGSSNALDYSVEEIDSAIAAIIKRAASRQS